MVEDWIHAYYCECLFYSFNSYSKCLSHAYVERFLENMKRITPVLTHWTHPKLTLSSV